MRPYLASVILGVAVGVVYGLVKVRSPAPPAIALLGLLGMLVGEQAVTLVRSHVFKSTAHRARPRTKRRPQIPLNSDMAQYLGIFVYLWLTDTSK
jgi:XapX domain-containing protein